MKIIKRITRKRLLKLIIENLQENTGPKSNNVYENEFSLIRTQDLFLVLLLHCVNVWETVSQLDVRQYYYKIMRLLLKASELELAQIGFKGESRNGVENSESKEINNRSFAKMEKEKK